MPKNLLVLVLTCICCTGCMTTPALPEQQLAALLQQHDIDVVINLRPKAADAESLQQHGLQSVHLPIHTWAIDWEDLLQVMQQIQSA